MRHGSVFAGIGGFDHAADRCGVETVWQIEIDPFCRKVLDARWPESKKYKEIADVDETELEWVDLVTSGFPCPDFSVAGKRKGIQGDQGRLFFRLAHVVAGVRPTWLLLENVPGLLSSGKGRDFALILHALDKLGYGLAWRVLDSQHFRVPQRRSRLFIVGHLGGPCPAEILFESPGRRRDTEESQEAGEGLAGTLGGGTGKSGWASDVERMTFLPMRTGVPRSGTWKGADHEHYVVHNAQGDPNWDRDRTPALDGQQPPAITVSLAARDWKSTKAGDALVVKGLRSGGKGRRPSPRGDGSDPLVVGPVTGGQGRRGWPATDEVAGGQLVLQPTNPHSREEEREYHPMKVAASVKPPTGNQGPFVAQALHSTDPRKGGPGDRLPLVAQPLRANRWGGADSHGDEGNVVAASLRTNWRNNSNPASEGRMHVAEELGVRRLTPTECERLQGFPDGWTAIGSDSSRYRALGNAVTVNVAEWIVRRLVAVAEGREPDDAKRYPAIRG